MTSIAPPVTFQKAQLDDVSELERIVHLAYRAKISKVNWKNEGHLVAGPRIEFAELQALIESENAYLLTARMSSGSAESIAGCVLVEHYGDEVHIGLLAVNPDFQNLGLGKLLVKEAERAAVSVFNCKTAKMFVLSGRPELLDWYRRLGYLPTGKTKSFPGPGSGLTSLQSNPFFNEISKSLDLAASDAVIDAERHCLKNMIDRNPHSFPVTSRLHM